MIGRRVDVVLIKLGAVVILIMTLQGIAGYAGFFKDMAESGIFIVGSVILQFVIPLCIATALWFYPATLAGDASSEGEHPASETGLIVVGVTLVGLYVLVFGIIDLAYWESLRIIEKQYADPVYGTYEPSISMTVGRVTCVLQVAIGSALLLGKHRIADLLKRAKKAGVDTQ